MNAQAPAVPVVRRIHGGPDADTPRHWFDGQAFETHFFNALSTTFPEGERSFILSVRAHADGITDPELQREIDAFVGQEGQHSREHEEQQPREPIRHGARVRDLVAVSASVVKRENRNNFARQCRRTSRDFTLPLAACA